MSTDNATTAPVNAVVSPLNCPCCNSGGVVFEIAEKWVVHCAVCGLHTRSCENADDAKRLWNRRFDMKTETECMEADGSTPAVRDQAIVMPWDAHAIELEEREGPYCVYVAWEEWIEDWNDRQSDSMRLDLDAIDKTALFSAFMAACSETPA